jgi:hypothetical protein
MQDDARTPINRQLPNSYERTCTYSMRRTAWTEARCPENGAKTLLASSQFEVADP